MDDDLRTAIVEYLDEQTGLGNMRCDIEPIAEGLEVYINKRGFYFYDERYEKPEKL